MKTLFLLVPFVANAFCDSPLSVFPTKSHEEWWEGSLDATASYDTFAGWLGDEQAPSRIAMRQYLKNNNYQSVLDIPCGLCIDYFGLKQEHVHVEYIGMDVTPKLIDIATQNKVPVLRASIENIPLSDSSIELAYSRHILEHLDDYKQAVKELIRVASKEVLVVFFIPPLDGDIDQINLSLDRGYPLYHNCYSRNQIESYLKTFDKVKNWKWEKVTAQEEFLHIYVD